jgi:hypothetical protein
MADNDAIQWTAIAITVRDNAYSAPLRRGIYSIR